MTDCLSRLRPCVPALLILAAGLCVLAPAAPAWAQVSNLDDQRFIQGLRERGMRDLMLFFIEKNPPDDPITKTEIEIETAKLLAEDDRATPEQRMAAFDKVHPTYLNLLRNQKIPFDFWKRPVWATDMVQYDFETLLRVRHMYAIDFVEFGGESGSNQKHKSVFREIAGEDATIMDEAFLDMQLIIGALPRDPDFEIKYVNTGIWRMLQEEYEALKLPFYRAMALRYAAMMPEAVQKEIAQIAGRTFPELLADADDRLAQLGARADLPPGTIAKVHNLHGRLKVARGDFQGAISALDKALAIKEMDPFERLITLLAKSQAQQGLKQDAEALKTVQDARKLVTADGSQIGNPVLLILTYARERELTGNDAVWTALLNDPTVAGDPELRAAVEGFVNEIIAGDDVDPEQMDPDATPQKVMAVVDKLIQKAQKPMSEAEVAKQQGNEQARIAHLKDAAEFLDPAVKLLEGLIARESIDPAARAQALMKLGGVEYGRGNRYQAGKAFLEVAKTHTDQPGADGAAVNSVILAKDIMDNTAGSWDNAEFRQLMEESLTTLIEKYPHTDQAKLHTYTLGAFYRQTDRFDQAIAVYQTVPANHPNYADALYELGVAQHQLMQLAADETARLAAAELAKTALTNAETALKQVIPGAGGERAKGLRYKLGDAILRRVDAMIELGQGGESTVALRGFADQFAEFPQLVKDARIANISVLIKLNRTDEAVAEVKQLSDDFPADAGPLTNRVLDLLNTRIEGLFLLAAQGAPTERPQREKDALKLAADAVTLSRNLKGWAKGRSDVASMVPFDLILARQLVLAREYDEASKLFATLSSAPGGETNQDIIFGKAQADYMMASSGQMDSAAAAKTESDAMTGVNKILRLGKPETATWWNAWIIRLEILDDRYERATAAGNDAEAKEIGFDIYRSVGRLEQTDPTLGAGVDPRFPRQLQRLKVKHAPR